MINLVCIDIAFTGFLTHTEDRSSFIFTLRALTKSLAFFSQDFRYPTYNKEGVKSSTKTRIGDMWLYVFGYTLQKKKDLEQTFNLSLSILLSSENK